MFFTCEERGESVRDDTDNKEGLEQVALR